MKNKLTKLGKVLVALFSATVLLASAACGSKTESIPKFCDGKKLIIRSKDRAVQEGRGNMWILNVTCSGNDNRGWGTVSWNQDDRDGARQWREAKVGSEYAG